MIYYCEWYDKKTLRCKNIKKIVKIWGDTIPKKVKKEGFRSEGMCRECKFYKKGRYDRQTNTDKVTDNQISC